MSQQPQAPAGSCLPPCLISGSTAITRGKAPSFFVMNGHDLMMILSEAISLTDFLRKRVRLLAEEGRVCVPFSELV